MELGEASRHDDVAGFSAVAGPAAGPREDPGGAGARASGMGVLLLFGFAFEASADALEHGLVVRVDDAAERALLLSLAFRHQPHELDSSDENGADQLFARPATSP